MDVGERRKEHETQKETKNPCESDSDLVVAFWEHDMSLVMGSHGYKMKKSSGEVWLFLTVCSVLDVNCVTLGWSHNPLALCFICKMESIVVSPIGRLGARLSVHVSKCLPRPHSCKPGDEHVGESGGSASGSGEQGLLWPELSALSLIFDLASVR